MIFGLFGTIITFVIFAALTIGFMEAGIMKKYNGETGYGYLHSINAVIVSILISNWNG